MMFLLFAMAAAERLTGCGDTPDTMTADLMEAFLKKNPPPPAFAARPKEAGPMYYGMDAIPKEERDETLRLDTVTVALAARQNFVHARCGVSDDMFNDYVLPYNVLDEPRSPSRAELAKLTADIIANDPAKLSEDATPQQSLIHNADLITRNLARVINKEHPEHALKFVGDSTPQRMNPEEIIDKGGASCTGMSILFVDALRSAGIPARVAGVEGWKNDINNGNHDWVEVNVGKCTECDSETKMCKDSGPTRSCDDWAFYDADQQLHENAPGLIAPCDVPFCASQEKSQNTEFIAQRAGTVTDPKNGIFPLAWDEDDKEYPGESRTENYKSMCSKCAKPEPAASVATTTVTSSQTTTVASPVQDVKVDVAVTLRTGQ